MSNLLSQADVMFRAALASVVVAESATDALAANANGFTRLSGSFVADGFAVGMQVLSTGFPAGYGPRVVLDVTPSALRIVNGLPSTANAATGRALRSFVPLPILEDNEQYEPVPGVPFTETELVAQPSVLLGAPYNNSTREDRGLFVVSVHGPLDVGTKALLDTADAVLTRFAPGTVLLLSDNTAMRVRTDATPFAGKIDQLLAAHARIVITIPWHAYRINAVQS